jgi:hypothetical protein
VGQSGIAEAQGAGEMQRRGGQRGGLRSPLSSAALLLLGPPPVLCPVFSSAPLSFVVLLICPLSFVFLLPPLSSCGWCSVPSFPLSSTLLACTNLNRRPTENNRQRMHATRHTVRCLPLRSTAVFKVALYPCKPFHAPFSQYTYKHRTTCERAPLALFE